MPKLLTLTQAVVEGHQRAIAPVIHRLTLRWPEGTPMPEMGATVYVGSSTGAFPFPYERVTDAERRILRLAEKLEDNTMNGWQLANLIADMANLAIEARKEREDGSR